MKKQAPLIIILLVIVLIAIIALISYNMTSSQDTVVCTQEAKLCPDGSYVGRNPDNGCAFDPCPSVEDAAVYCTPESRETELCLGVYQPVCGWFDPAQVQCIKYPCAQTFSNSCVACGNDQVLYYTEGECPE